MMALLLTVNSDISVRNQVAGLNCHLSISEKLWTRNGIEVLQFFLAIQTLHTCTVGFRKEVELKNMQVVRFYERILSCATALVPKREVKEDLVRRISFMILLW